MRAMRMGSALGRPSLVAPALLVVLALGASACTGDDGDDEAQGAEELPVEVEGEVLDRRDDDDDGDAATGDDTDADDADADGSDADGSDADGSDADGEVTDGEVTAGGATDDRDGADADTSSTPRTTERAPARPAPTRTPAATPAPTPSPTRAPAPSPTPTASPTPTPRTLRPGAAEPTGPVLDSDGTSWTETSSTSLERGAEPPPLTVAMRPGEDAPQRQVRCQAALEAPSDRGLAVRGTLTVSLRIVVADGSVQVVPRQRIELDLVVPAGEQRVLDVSPGRTVDVADVRQVSCVAELTD